MAKTVDSIKRALKLRAEPKRNSLTLRMGVKKLPLPFEVRLITSGDYLFVHVPPSAELFKIDEDGLQPVQSVEEAQSATQSFRRGGKRGKRGGRASAQEMPEQLMQALRAIPSGFKLGFNPDGTPRLVKTRKRR